MSYGAYYVYNYLGYGLIIIGSLITVIASFYCQSKMRTYKEVNTKTGLSGVEVARHILDEAGLNDVHVVEIKGNLTDHYDPRHKVVRLSTDVYHGATITSNSVAAHECGHAIQHKEGYFFIKLRGFIAPLVNISSYLGYIAIMIGLLAGILNLAWAGVGLLLLMLIFELVTLPTEFNASSRALEILERDNILDSTEIMGSKSALRAAALTYVASLANTILQILRLVLTIVASSRDN